MQGKWQNVTTTCECRLCVCDAKCTWCASGAAGGARPAAPGCGTAEPGWIGGPGVAELLVVVPPEGGAVVWGSARGIGSGGIAGGSAGGWVLAGAAEVPDWSSSDELWWGDIMGSNKSSEPRDRST